MYSHATCNFCSDYVAKLAIECFSNVYQVYSLQAAVISSSLRRALQRRHVSLQAE